MTPDTTEETTAVTDGATEVPILVPPAWLEGRLGHAGLSVVDMREESAYAESHLPGAVHLDLARLGTSREDCDNVLLPAEEFSALMGELGITNTGIVLAYDDQWGLAASRLVWALHVYGHADAAVLDGGWDRWQDEGRPTTARPTTRQAAAFEARVNPDVSAPRAWIATHPTSGGVRLLDTRTPAEFEQGHLPGAKVWDWFNAVPPASWDASRDPGELLAEWESMDVRPENDVVVYCRSGMRAAHTYVVLRNAGFPRVRLYDGSWQEWSAGSSGGGDG